jgi:hypothetical protein
MLDAIRGFVEHGGHWIETGGYSFYVPAWRDGTGWHTEVAGPAALARLGVPVASGPLDRAAESLAPTALGTSLLGAAWAALVQGKTSVVNRALPADTSDPGHLGLLAGSSGDFFGGYRLNGWGGLWRLGGMNPNPETAVPTVAATLEYLATHPPLPPTPGPARYLWHVVVRTHPPRLEDASAASGRFEFQIADCAPHATHAVERSIRWQDPSGWEEVSRFVPQTPAARFAESQPASGPGACYRVRILDGP